MNIEGAEREAPAGAWDTLRRFKPRLAIGSYHLPDDRLMLPSVVRAASLDYSITIGPCCILHDTAVPCVLYGRQKVRETGSRPFRVIACPKGVWDSETRLSCHRFQANEVRLWLSVIGYNLGDLWRRLLLPSRAGNWPLTSLQQRLVKTGGRVVEHARY